MQPGAIQGVLLLLTAQWLGACVRKIFISYRRADTQALSRSLYERLAKRLGKRRVFIDVDSLPAATDFPTYIDNTIRECGVQLVVIGEHWLEGADSKGRPLQDPENFVHREIRTALDRKVRILTLLADNAPMPTQEIPKGLEEIATIAALPLHCDAYFDQDACRVVKAVTPLVREWADYLWRAMMLVVLLLVVGTGVLKGQAFLRALTNGHTSSTPPQCCLPTPIPVPDSHQVAHLGYSALDTLDPQLLTTLDAYRVAQMIFPGLIEYTPDLHVAPWAATSWDVTSDGLVYTFHLRANLAWSDGDAIGADDFAYAMNRALDPCTSSPTASFLLPIADAASYHAEPCTDGAARGSISTLIGDSIIAVDARTPQIKLARPTSGFVSMLCFPTSFAVPRGLIAIYGRDSTGHLADHGGLGGDLFMLTAWDTNTGAITLTHNGRFWGHRARLIEVDFTRYADADAMYSAYAAGSGEVSAVPTDTYAAAKLTPDFHEGSALSTVSLSVNWTLPPFDDLRMRQAFAVALNKQQLARDTEADTSIATNHLIVDGIPGYNADLKGPDNTTGLTGNATLARSLAQAYANDRCGGDVRKCPPVTLTVPVNPLYSTLSTAMQGMWQAAIPGYPITIHKEAFNVIHKEVASKGLQLVTLAIAGNFPDPQDFLSNWFLPGAPYNWGRVDLPTATSLMTQADAQTDQAQRLAAYQQAEQTLVTQVGLIPLFQAQAFYVVRRYVVGYAVTALQVPSSATWQAIYIARH